MPSQVCHLIFAEDALRQALGRVAQRILEERGNIFRFGAQGPDFFYHNQRTRPTGLKFGVSAHRQHYGKLVANMIRELRRLEVKGQEDLPLIKAYILGFCTHSFLDKKAHPFIDYFAGWVEAEREETEKFFRSHIFLERILDVLMLERKRSLSIRELDLPLLLNCGPRLPYGIIKTLVKSLHRTYPDTHFKSRDRRRVENAYRDCMSFYAFIDPLKPHYRRLAYELDRNSAENRRRLALFHPYELPEHLDFLNLEHRSWTHPCNREWRHNESFPELFDQALEEAVPAVAEIARILEGEGEADRAEALLGNQSLGTGLNWQDNHKLLYNDPLPLPELLDRMYREFSESPAAGRHV
jgi:hypothetical protein